MTLNDDEYIRNVEAETAIKYIAEQTGNRYVAESKDMWAHVACNFPFVATDGKKYNSCLWFNKNTNCYFARIVNGETVRIINDKFGKVINIIKNLETQLKELEINKRKEALKEDFK